ncbi:hypothetical protein QEN19_002252 [Hanseniaspora menglaensis]
MKRSESKMEDSKIKENKKKVKRAPTVATATLYDILHFSHNTADYSKSSLILRNSLTGKKYLIGSVSEGFQRLVFQHNTGVQFSSFYLTGRLNWSSVSGLPGCLITIADALEQLKLKISYPNNYLKFLLATTRHFILRKSINIDVDTKPESKQEDGFTVTPLITYPVSVEPGNIEKESFSESELQQLDDIISTVFKQSLPAECVTEGENNMDEDNFGQISLAHQKLLNNLITKINIKPHTTSYHIKFENIKGTFNAAKANELNVPNGRERGILSNGKSITLTDGTIVTPDQVMGERKSFADILVLDIPDNSYLSNMKKEILESNPDSSVDLNDTDLYYIFLSSDFNINQDFIEFLEVLKKQTSNQAKIFVSHPKISPNEIMYDQFLTKILKKKKKLPNNYPVPNDDRIFSQKFFESYPSLKKFLFNEKEVKMDGVSNENTEVCLNNEKVNVFCSRDIINNKARNSSETNINCLTLNIKDRKEFDLSEKINQISKSTKGSLPLNPVFFKTLDSESAHEVEVMTLGTASACPGISANVSGNLLKVPYYNTESKEKSLVFGVLDAGEGTLNTMRRLFNENNIKYVFENFKFLYLSHLHADHHLGFVSLIQEWYKYNFKDESARLYVICPSNFFRFLVEALANEPLILEKIVGISCEEFKVNKRVDRGTYLNFLYKGKLITEDNDNLIENCYDALNMEKLETVAAIHCAFSYSVAMTFKTSIGLQLNDKKLFKISYSGDTRPSNRFATKIGLETDLLIHEATFPNEFQDHAFKKKHSTVGEALKVAEKMNCDNVVLTHFSQRTMDNIYKDILPFVKQVGSKQRFTCIANDGLIVSSESLPKCCEVDVQRAYKLMKRTSMTKTREGSDSDSE